MHETSDRFFYSLITFAYMYFVHSYTVDVLFTLSYNSIFQSIFGICSTWKYVMLEIRNHNPNEHLIIVSMHMIGKNCDPTERANRIQLTLLNTSGNCDMIMFNGASEIISYYYPFDMFELFPLPHWFW